MKHECNFEQFCDTWKSELVYKTSEIEDLDLLLHEMYVNYKTQKNEPNAELFLAHWYEDVNLDTHPFMLKDKAIKDKRFNKGLLALISKNIMNNEYYVCTRKGGKENCAYRSKDFFTCVSLRKCEFAKTD